jgi:hypothetical protein
MRGEITLPSFMASECIYLESFWQSAIQLPDARAVSSSGWTGCRTVAAGRWRGSEPRGWIRRASAKLKLPQWKIQLTSVGSMASMRPTYSTRKRASSVTAGPRLLAISLHDNRERPRLVARVTIDGEMRRPLASIGTPGDRRVGQYLRVGHLRSQKTAQSESQSRDELHSRSWAGESLKTCEASVYNLDLSGRLKSGARFWSSSWKRFSVV